MDLATGCPGGQVEPTPALAAQMNGIWCFPVVLLAVPVEVDATRSSIPSVIYPGGCPEVEDLLANLGSARSTEKTGFHPSTVEFALLRLILPQQLAKSHSFSTRAGSTCPPG